MLPQEQWSCQLSWAKLSCRKTCIALSSLQTVSTRDAFLGSSDGAPQDKDPARIAQPRSQREGSPFQDLAPMHTQWSWCRMKRFLKPLGLHVEARMLEKMLSPSRVLLPGFEHELKVLLQMREPKSEGKVGIFITGGRWDRKRARRLIGILAANPLPSRPGGNGVEAQ